MTNINRERLLDKIRGLLSKTIENGCTEAEAIAALAKARGMMDAYEVTEEDLQLAKEEAAVLREASSENDKYNIGFYLVTAVSLFCDVQGWRRRATGKFIFAGMPSDVQFADWLHMHLIAFVREELAKHLATCDAPKGMRRRIINGFVEGCTYRIIDRVRAMVAASKAAQAAGSNSRALVVVKQDAIRSAMDAAGVTLRSSSSRRVSDGGARAAGSAAGDRATFGRPIGGNAVGRLT